MAMLRVLTPRLPEGQKIKVCGSSTLLGGWNPELAPTMTCGAAIPLWTLNVDLLPDDEFKFILCTDEGYSWEEGANRSLRNRGPIEFRGLPQWKATGVAIPVFSLRSESDFGVGDFEDLKLMADWAASRGMSVLQILPINDTTMTRTHGDSYPYSANSSFALHPLYLRPDLIGKPIDTKLLRKLKAEQKELQRLTDVDYERVIALKETWVRAVFEQDGEQTLLTEEFADFMGQNYFWLLPYAAFSTLRDSYRNPDFHQWKEQYSPALIYKMLADPSSRHEMEYYFFLQYHLHRQLISAAKYCRSKGVALKGDIPIGISPLSCDAWQNSKLFNLDMQAGAPPDAFAIDGQNWGFPTYNWQRMAKDGYAWWRARLEKMAEYFDAYRIDHVLGFFRIWEIPVPQESGLLGHFSPALPFTSEEMLQQFGFRFDPYMAPVNKNCLFISDPYESGRYHPRIMGYETEMFAALPPDQKDSYRRLHEEFFYHRNDKLWEKNALQRLPAVVDATPMLACAEDLGMIPACVPGVLESLQVLTLEVQRMPKQFGVEVGNPATYPYMSVATTSTHDMAPLRLWSIHQRQCDLTAEECGQVIADHVGSPAMLTILPFQDWTAAEPALRSATPESEQINIPADPHHYWRYRMHITL